MTDKQFRDLIDEHGYKSLFEKMYDHLLYSEIINNMDVEIMDSFLSHFEFDEDTSFEEFVYLYIIFSNIYEKDKFPVIY
jgi:hypothetical protein